MRVPHLSTYRGKPSRIRWGLPGKKHLFDAKKDFGSYVYNERTPCRGVIVLDPTPSTRKNTQLVLTALLHEHLHKIDYVEKARASRRRKPSGWYLPHPVIDRVSKTLAHLFVENGWEIHFPKETLPAPLRRPRRPSRHRVRHGASRR